MDQNKLTFDELVQHHTRNIHSALLEGGGKEMGYAILTAMNWAIMWYQEQQNGKQEKLNIEIMYNEETSLIDQLEKEISMAKGEENLYADHFIAGKIWGLETAIGLIKEIEGKK